MNTNPQAPSTDASSRAYQKDANPPASSAHAHGLRTPLRVRAAAGVAAVAITSTLVASQLGIASMYSGEAEALLAELRSSMGAVQVAMTWARKTVGI